MADEDLGFDASINLNLENMQEFTNQVSRAIQDAMSALRLPSGELLGLPSGEPSALSSGQSPLYLPLQVNRAITVPMLPEPLMGLSGEVEKSTNTFEISTELFKAAVEEFIKRGLANIEGFDNQVLQSLRKAIQLPENAPITPAFTEEGIDISGRIIKYPKVETKFTDELLAATIEEFDKMGIYEPPRGLFDVVGTIVNNRMVEEKLKKTEGLTLDKSIFEKFTPEYMDELAEKYKGFAQEGQNVVKSFWSVWSISWAIRGVIGDIFGYSSKWVAETNKLTRAFQSGLYLYAGAQRMIAAINNHIEKTNEHAQRANGLAADLAYRINKDILETENKLMLAKNEMISLTKEEIEDEERKLKNLQMEKVLAKEYMLDEQTLASAETAMTRMSVQRLGQIISMWAGIAVAAIGVVRWIQNMNDQINKGRAEMRQLKTEISASINPVNTLKTSFTDIEGLVNKIKTSFPEMVTVLDQLTDPLEQYGLALAIIAENALPSRGLKDLFSVQPDNMTALENYQKSLKEMFTPLAENAEMMGLLNAILAANNAGMKDNLDTTEKVTEALEKYGDEMARIISMPIRQEALKEIEEEIAIVRSQIENPVVPEGQDMAEYIDGLKERLLELIAIARGVAIEDYEMVRQYLLAGGEKLKKNVEDTGTAATEAMTMIEFYTRMYEAMNDASELNSKYSQEAIKWKNLLIKALNAEIKSLGEEISMLDKTSEAYKQKSVERAEYIRQLEELISLQEKLNSTWFNIPTAIIKPTQAQLTGATVYLSPNINIKASGIDEIVRIAQDEIGKALYDNLKLQRGNVGGAI